jgi:hypothetical protein
MQTLCGLGVKLELFLLLTAPILEVVRLAGQPLSFSGFNVAVVHHGT